MPVDLPAFLNSIPTRIAALRAASELSRLRANVAADLRSLLEPKLDRLLQAHREGQLAERWKTALEKAKQRGLEGEQAQHAALFVLMREQLAHVLDAVGEQSQTWEADSFRTDGACKELERVEKELLASSEPITAEASDISVVTEEKPHDHT
jgi:hypothetical protein